RIARPIYPPPLRLRTRWTRFSLSSRERTGVRASFQLPPSLHHSLPAPPHHHSNHRRTNNPSSIIHHPSSVPRHHSTNLSRRSPTKADPSIHQSTNPPPLQLRTRWTRFSLSSGERAGVRASFPLPPSPPPLQHA